MLVAKPSNNSIRIEPCIRQIIDRYAGRSDNSVFPILKSEDMYEAYSQYLTAMAYYNRLLKRVSHMLGCSMDSHLTRHDIIG